MLLFCGTGIKVSRNKIETTEVGGDSGRSEKFPDDLKSVQMIWKESRWSEKSPDDLKSVWMIWKVSGWSEKWIIQMVCTVCGWFRKCPKDLENIQIIHKMCFYLWIHILPNSFLHWHWYQNCCLTHFYNAPVSALYLASFFMEKKEGRRRALPSIQFSWNFYQIISGTKMSTE